MIKNIYFYDFQMCNLNLKQLRHTFHLYLFLNILIFKKEKKAFFLLNINN